MAESLPARLPRSLQVLKLILYVLAGVILLAGLILGISLIAGAGRTAENFLMPLNLFGAGAAYNLLAPIVRGSLINLGIASMIVSLILSALLYAQGRLISHISALESRLARLEQVSG